jgi:uncharacterized alpha-E superfamily protein
MLCRVAESLFWMSRYLERAENQARFIDVTSNIALGYRGSELDLWSSLLHAGGDVDDFKKTYSAPTQENVIRYLLFDQQNLNSVVNCLAAARENARSIRENLTTPMWEAVNRFYLRVRTAASESNRVIRQPHSFLEQIKRSANQVMGVSRATWSRGEAWHFSCLGYYIERADKTSRILDVKYFILLPDPSHVGSQVDAVQWAALLESTSALQMYRREYGRIEPANVVEFLILNTRFPRSMRFCVREAELSIRSISGTPLHSFSNSAEQLVAQLNAKLNYARATDVIASGLHQFVDDFQSQLNGIGAAVAESFFQVDMNARRGMQSQSSFIR